MEGDAWRSGVSVAQTRFRGHPAPAASLAGYWWAAKHPQGGMTRSACPPSCSGLDLPRNGRESRSTLHGGFDIHAKAPPTE